MMFLPVRPAQVPATLRDEPPVGLMASIYYTINFELFNFFFQDYSTMELKPNKVTSQGIPCTWLPKLPSLSIFRLDGLVQCV